MKHSPESFIDPQITHSGSQSVGNQDSTTIDCLGFREAGLSLDVATVGSSGTIDIQIMESDASGSGFVAVTPAVAFTQITAAGQALVSIDLERRKRYLRVRLVIGTAASTVNGQLILMSPNRSEDIDYSQWEKLRVA